ncbi:unnamed protein product [Vitrella brassicaformis CCMP3155]|uniref:Uncharacterized protein n=1 Tax=Vitrella brassicaformis (strain CCMP3155) TaxID=1169540 RepID=A0A0G4G5Z2_VITBC|nr:unnamed protein product [Vitrella brassicaformis CCMP3155]|eukprot:CEM23823.1 unnamed protein product [Vitrella brassicaformis CCMP3155]
MTLRVGSHIPPLTDADQGAGSVPPRTARAAPGDGYSRASAPYPPTTSGGIGNAAAVAFAEKGATIAIHYSGNEAKAKATLEAVEKAGGSGAIFQADLSRVSEITRLYDEVYARFGSLDVVFLNSGVLHVGTIRDTPEDVYDHLMDVNVKGTFFSMQEAIKRMGKGGVIILNSSVAGSHPIADHVCYCASKAAVNMLTKCGAKEAGEKGIRVNAVAPGPVLPGMFPASMRKDREAMSPFKRIGEAKEVAALCVALASEDMGWVSGQVIGVDGAAYC